MFMVEGTFMGIVKTKKDLPQGVCRKPKFLDLLIQDDGR